ncbi:MAG: hypothetical protein FJ086_07935 [Deltaproteobacteria bacterium]|nr:hypothetical protein [Deltaproteobacteria bacterium]
MNSSLALRGLALALAVFVTSRAEATVVLQQSFEEMTADAHLVVRGVALRSASRWDDEGRRINTWTELRVTEVLKGSAGSTVLVRQAGGVVGGVGQSVAGAAEFREGEEVLLFLVHPGDDPKGYVVSSMAMGKVTLSPDAFGKPRAWRDGHGMGLYEPRGGKVRLVDGREDLGPAEPFLARIRAAVRGGGGK